MEHTPGPWQAYARHVHNDGTQDEMGGLGWDIHGPPKPQLRGQFSLAGDAYLVAAAPDLLAALENAVVMLRTYGENVGCIEECAAAIAKAKGEQQTEKPEPDFVYTTEQALAETWTAEGKPGHIDGCTTYAECMASDCQCSCHE